MSLIEGLDYSDVPVARRFLAISNYNDGLKSTEGSAIELRTGVLENTVKSATVLIFFYNSKVGDSLILQEDNTVLVRLPDKTNVNANVSLRTIWTILWSSLRYLGETTSIDRSTGKIISHRTTK
ncbi:MAG: hypothetical protein Q8T09_02955 [Candidatus Melainabacteria bacterium]|nr:hypothetical protein [Candidatus Melainabacteria bacterium]